jgi:hypothetical protein
MPVKADIPVRQHASCPDADGQKLQPLSGDKNEHDCDSVFKLYESPFRVTDVGRFLPDSPTSTNGRFFH